MPLSESQRLTQADELIHTAKAKVSAINVTTPENVSNPHGAEDHRGSQGRR
jgi:hypothetical protein